MIFTVFSGLHRNLTSAPSTALGINLNTIWEPDLITQHGDGWMGNKCLPSRFLKSEEWKLTADDLGPQNEMFNNACNVHMSAYFWPDSNELCVMNQNLGCSNYFILSILLINQFFCVWRLTYSQVGIRYVVSCKASPSFIIVWEDNFLLLHTVVEFAQRTLQCRCIT